jgi:hypothetical protein
MKQPRKQARDARDFNTMETQDVIKFIFPAKQGAGGNSRHSDRTTNLISFLVGQRTYHHLCEISYEIYIFFILDTNHRTLHIYGQQGSGYPWGFFEAEISPAGQKSSGNTDPEGFGNAADTPQSDNVVSQRTRSDRANVIHSSTHYTPARRHYSDTSANE